MARKNVVVYTSDVSGAEVQPNGNLAQVRITIRGDRYDLDASEEEVIELTKVARKTAKRGRKPKAAA